MIKIFLDSDIILDLLLKRKEHESIAILMTDLIRKKFLGFTTPIVIANIHYIMTKLADKKKSIENIKKLRKFISIMPINEKIIDDALNHKSIDFEDSIQYLTAEKNQIDFIITRNKNDYKKSKIPVFNAKEFINLKNSSIALG